MQLNENFTKEEILTFYVNDLEYAEGSTGLGAIMRTYFNKGPEDYVERNVENIAELSYLAGLSRHPASTICTPIRKQLRNAKTRSLASC